MSTDAPIIDAVIPWVDGNDPAHRAALARHLATLGRAPPPAADPTRFHDSGEIDWCVASILRFAPFVRTIHVLTAGQRPRLFDRLAGTPWAARLRLVDHRESFRGYEHCLPSFNSRAIISTLHRIPDLAEHYLFFNDDFALIREVAPQDFFRGDRVVVRGSWLPQSHRRWTRRLVLGLRRRLGRDPEHDPAARVRNVAAQEYSARLAGYADEFLRVEHLPFPQRRSTLEAYFRAHPERLAENLAHRLRSPRQFKAEVLALHLECRAGRACFDRRLRTVQLKPSEQAALRVRWKLAQADRSDRASFVCVQSLELAPVALRDRILNWLGRRIGPLPWDAPALQASGAAAVPDTPA